jgi:putative transposase
MLPEKNGALRGATVRQAGAEAAPDLVQRGFTAAQANALWITDITCVPTWAGSLYLAVMLDVFSSRVVGWAMATHLRTASVLDALEMAIGQRRPVDVIHFSDKVSQYAAVAFGARCRKAGSEETSS